MWDNYIFFYIKKHTHKEVYNIPSKKEEVYNIIIRL